MEIASPLSFHRSLTAGTKRQFSPSSQMTEETLDNASSGSSMMIEAAKHDTPPTNPFKRRRCFRTTDEASNENSHNVSSMSLSASPLDRVDFSSVRSNNFFNGNFYGGSAAERPRPETSAHAATQKLASSQSEEIEALRAENNELQKKLQAVETEKMKTSEENRILKRGVAIQVGRHSHVVSDLNLVKQENAQLKDQNGKLEQQVQSLRYQLQAQSYNIPINDFMGFPPRPPDVF